MSIGDNIKTFFQGFFHHDLKVGKAEIPTGGIIGGTAALIESKEAKELAEAKTNENEQVEANIEEPCCPQQEMINKAKESPAGKHFTKRMQVMHDVGEKIPGWHDTVKKGGLLKMGLDWIKDKFGKKD